MWKVIWKLQTSVSQDLRISELSIEATRLTSHLSKRRTAKVVSSRSDSFLNPKQTCAAGSANHGRRCRFARAILSYAKVLQSFLVHTNDITRKGTLNVCQGNAGHRHFPSSGIIGTYNLSTNAHIQDFVQATVTTVLTSEWTIAICLSICEVTVATAQNLTPHFRAKKEPVSVGHHPPPTRPASRRVFKP